MKTLYRISNKHFWHMMADFFFRSWIKLCKVNPCHKYLQSYGIPKDASAHNVTVTVLKIREVSSSYQDRIPTEPSTEYYFLLGHEVFLPHPCHLIIRYNFITQRCIVCVIQSLKYNTHTIPISLNAHCLIRVSTKLTYIDLWHSCIFRQ
jgi:hypothetical protein